MLTTAWTNKIKRCIVPNAALALDGLPARHYIHLPMNRIFLALLALFAGLVAPVGSAEARIRLGSETEFGLVSTQRLGARSAAPQTATVDQAATAKQERRERAAPRVKPVRPRVFIPSVFFQVDRALE